MKELFTMWRYTKMIILTAFSAAIYAAILIPFKVVIPLIPGFTEFRPANAIPVVCSIFFGPAGAWGSAIGNFIGDALGGTFGLGSIFGFWGNFLYGLIPYKIVYGLKKSEKDFISFNLPILLWAIFNASLSCAVFIGWGVDMLGLVPFSALASIIFLNNFIVAGILSPILIQTLQKRIRNWHFVYTDIMDEKDLHPFRGNFIKRLGMALLFIGGISGMILGIFISAGIYKSGLLAFGFAQGVKGSLSLSLGLIPSVILIIIGLFLL